MKEEEIKFEYTFSADNVDDIPDETTVFTLAEIRNGAIDDWLSCCYLSSAKVVSIKQLSPPTKQ